MQGRYSGAAIYAMEVVARVFVLFNYTVADNELFYSDSTFKKECNQKGLFPALDNLKEMYRARNASRMRPNEMEMYGYQKILMMGHWFPGTTWGVQKTQLAQFLASEQWCDSVATAHNERFVRFFRALSSNRYTKFYKEVAAADVSFLEACLLSGTFYQVRVKQLQALNVSSDRSDKYTVSELTALMNFDDDVQTLRFVDHFVYPAVRHSTERPGLSTVKMGLGQFRFWNHCVTPGQPEKRHLNYWDERSIARWIEAWGPSFAHLATLRLTGPDLLDTGFEKSSLYVAAAWGDEQRAALIAGRSVPGVGGAEGKWECDRRRRLRAAGAPQRGTLRPAAAPIYVRGQSLARLEAAIARGANARRCVEEMETEVRDGVACARADIAAAARADLSGLRVRKLAKRLGEMEKELAELEAQCVRVPSPPSPSLAGTFSGTFLRTFCASSCALRLRPSHKANDDRPRMLVSIRPPSTSRSSFVFCLSCLFDAESRACLFCLFCIVRVLTSPLRNARLPSLPLRSRAPRYARRIATDGEESVVTRLKMHVSMAFETLLYPPAFLFTCFAKLKNRGPRFPTNTVRDKLLAMVRASSAARGPARAPVQHQRAATVPRARLLLAPPLPPRAHAHALARPPSNTACARRSVVARNSRRVARRRCGRRKGARSVRRGGRRVVRRGAARAEHTRRRAAARRRSPPNAAALQRWRAQDAA